MHTGTSRFAGLVVREHEFIVSLDYARPGDEEIAVIAREVVAAGREDTQLPWLVFFRGDRASARRGQRPIPDG